VSDWATGFVWNPFVWVGLIVAVVGLGLIAASTRLPGGRRSAPARPEAVRAQRGKAPAGADLGLGEDLDDIQAILRKHNIS
jgi:hypothetical protein